MNEKKVYKNTDTKTPLLTTILSDCATPIIKVKFSNTNKPFYYPNSPKIPRYSVTCLLDNVEHIEFIKTLQQIERNEGVKTIIKKEFDKDERGGHFENGKFVVKFQTKDKIPVFVHYPDTEPMILEMEDEFSAGEDVSVVFDILRYTKKGTAEIEHGISFKPTQINYYPKG